MKSEAPVRDIKRVLLCAAAALVLMAVLIEGAGIIIERIQVSRWMKELRSEKLSGQISAADKTGATASKEAQRLQRQIQRLAPRSPYILIDTAANKLYLKNRDKILLEAVVSCGSGSILDEPNGTRRWIFDTPRGIYAVDSKLRHPDWVKPDWAFIEEGESIPKNPAERVESGVMGDYALGFGDGFFIHGTLYTRLLGRNVTHGCIRVGDEPLEQLYRAAGLGTPVIIF